ncbi:MAG: FtsX-like permease family protein [Chloroflexi bacterium]|nr:FtsX-like permease family protein [Chloroflexota bacterium]
MFWRVLMGSLRHRRARLGVATLAVLLGAAMVSALLNLSFDVGGQSGRELRAYGANVLLLPRGASLGPGSLGQDQGIPERDLAALDGFPEVVGYAPYLYLTTEVRGQPVVAAGVDFDRLRAIGGWWQVEGTWPTATSRQSAVGSRQSEASQALVGAELGQQSAVGSRQSEASQALVGAELARALGLAPGDRITVGPAAGRLELVVAGVVEVGGAEDSQIFLPLSVAQDLSGRPGQVGLVQVSVLSTGRPLTQIATEIEGRLPGVQARTLRQFAQAEEAVLTRVRLLMALAAAAVLIVAALAVASTMVTAMMERRVEIGLMKALGAAERRVAAIFLAEAMSVGALGGIGGYAVGLGAAALIGRQVFGAGLQPSPLGLPATLAVAVGVVLAASLWPMRRAMATDPAVTLRGE